MAELEIVRLSEIQSKEVEWLWYPYIPSGKLTIIQGDPGCGKTNARGCGRFEFRAGGRAA